MLNKKALDVIQRINDKLDGWIWIHLLIILKFSDSEFGEVLLSLTQLIDNRL